MTTTAAEIRGHFGWHVDADAFTRGHFGRLWLEETAVVVVAPTKSTSSRNTNLSPGGANSLWVLPQEIVLDETALLELARETAELSQRPELRTWVSSVLSQAGRLGRDLATETAIAQTILAEVQPMVARPLVKTAHLGAGLLAVGLHVTLVAHGQVQLDKTLIAVYVDGGWRYADPHGAFDLGETVPFKVEKFVPIPNLAPPEPVVTPATPAAPRARTVTWQEVQAPPEVSETDALMQQILQGILADMEPTTPPAPAWRPIHTVLVVGALGIAALALWQVYEARKELRELRPVQRKRLGAPGG